jgi:hypothetical protein
MSKVTYHIVRQGHEWAVRVGTSDTLYPTAVEAATAAARSAVRRGCEVTIQVEGEAGKVR